MARLARVVLVDEPHQVTQRASLGQNVFDTGLDRKNYMAMLLEYKKRHSLNIWAYCLMDNHVHFVAVPKKSDSLALVFSKVHMRHAQRINFRRKQRGHLWQGRFFSAVLDEPYMWAAVRYVENNPVRAGMVEKAEEYAWSSARAHCKGIADPILSTEFPPAGAVKNWAMWLRKIESTRKIEHLRKMTCSGKPCGEKDFASKVGKILGREFGSQPIGRPKKQKN